MDSSICTIAPVAIRRILSTINDMADCDMNEVAFTEFAKTHPTMLYPTTTIQAQIRKKVLGASKWKRFCRVRASESIGREQIQELYNDMRPHLGQAEAALASDSGPLSSASVALGKGNRGRGSVGAGAKKSAPETHHPRTCCLLDVLVRIM